VLRTPRRSIQYGYSACAAYVGAIQECNCAMRVPRCQHPAIVAFSKWTCLIKRLLRTARVCRSVSKRSGITAVLYVRRDGRQDGRIDGHSCSPSSDGGSDAASNGAREVGSTLKH